MAGSTAVYGFPTLDLAYGALTKPPRNGADDVRLLRDRFYIQAIIQAFIDTLSQGEVKGARTEMLLQKYLELVAKVEDRDVLKRPYRCKSTIMVTGGTIWQRTAEVLSGPVF